MTLTLTDLVRYHCDNYFYFSNSWFI